MIIIILYYHSINKSDSPILLNPKKLSRKIIYATEIRKKPVGGHCS